MEDALSRWRAAPKRPLHPALARWTEHALGNYLAAAADIPAPPSVPHGEQLEPVSRVWARQRGSLNPGDPDVYEEMVTDRRYAGHGVRELRVIRTGSVHDRPPDEVEIAIAVGVLAGGSPVLSSRWSRSQLKLGRFAHARLVRLVEVGCVDASHQILFEGTPDEAYARYDTDVEADIGKVIAGGSYRPGQDCGRCDIVDSCPEVPSRPGLLKISSTDMPRRSWSMSTGRSYRQCPARVHLEDLFLPREGSAENNEAVVRGQAVHAWIENLHRRTPQQPCTPADIPDSPEAWECAGWKVTGTQARLGIQMIGDHALVCPLRDRTADAEVHPERTAVVYDPDADVVVIAKTDLLYRVADRWTLRETKTARALSEGDLLERYPQLALAVVLARAGVLPGGGHCRVELERLAGSGPVLTEVDIAAPDVVAQAQRVLKEHVSAWHADTRFPTKAGKACGDCPFTRWCPDASERTDS
ncbi:PD-(D/E)XK nuclease family protein [Streptomyces mayteni]